MDCSNRITTGKIHRARCLSKVKRERGTKSLKAELPNRVIGNTVCEIVIDDCDDWREGDWIFPNCHGRVSAEQQQAQGQNRTGEAQSATEGRSGRRIFEVVFQNELS